MTRNQHMAAAIYIDRISKAVSEQLRVRLQLMMNTGNRPIGARRCAASRPPNSSTRSDPKSPRYDPQMTPIWQPNNAPKFLLTLFSSLDRGMNLSAQQDNVLLASGNLC